MGVVKSNFGNFIHPSEFFASPGLRKYIFLLGGGGTPFPPPQMRTCYKAIRYIFVAILLLLFPSLSIYGEMGYDPSSGTMRVRYILSKIMKPLPCVTDLFWTG